MILTLYASAGGGHRSVALALDEAIAEQEESHAVADALSFSGPIFRHVYKDGYEFVAQHMRWFCRSFFTLTDKPRSESALVRTLENGTCRAISGLAALLGENNIDIACCTHFLPLSFMGYLRRKGIYEGAIHACVTDYDVHGFWFEPEADVYYVATDQAARRLHSWGVPQENLHVTGIPVRRSFRNLPQTAASDPARLRVLVIASSLRTREVFRILHELALPRLLLDVTLVAGRNPNLLKQLGGYRPPRHMRLETRAFEPHMDRLMSNADLLISKPGGITCTEALCAGLPMLFVAPIPMHEVHNARIFEELGAGKLCVEDRTIAQALRDFHLHPELRESMRQACRAAARPYATEAVAHTLCSLTKASPRTPDVEEFQGLPPSRSGPEVSAMRH